MMIEIKTKNITFMKIKTKKLNEEDSNDDMQTDPLHQPIEVGYFFLFYFFFEGV